MPQIVDIEGERFATQATRRVGDRIDFTWSFNCGGRACRYGTFINGDLWVVPIDDEGNRVENVTITSITPDGGAMVNPEQQDTHGLMDRWPDYREELDIGRHLPYAASANTSIIKAATKPNVEGDGCPAYGSRQAGQCSRALDILTVLGEVPPDNGASIFRPPYVGVEKPLRSANDLCWNRLPRLPGVTGSEHQADFGWIRAQQSSPTVTMMQGSLEIYRGLAPVDIFGRDYAADLSRNYLEQLVSTFGVESNEVKAGAIYALIQPGLDNYGVFMEGFRLGTGAGQHLGRKPPMVFAMSMFDDPEAHQNVQDAVLRSEEGIFQEDAQIFTTNNSITPLWGDLQAGDHEGAYWQRFGYDATDNTKNMRDPYGYVDGPAHGPNGGNYQHVVNGPFMAFAFAQHVMPFMKWLNNDWEILTYVDRVHDGRGHEGFSGGRWALPDPCAPKSGTYGEDYGPKPGEPGSCVEGEGRFTGAHGSDVGSTRVPLLTLSLWSDFRDCSDIAHPSYRSGVCETLGAEPVGFEEPVRILTTSPE